MNPGSRAAHATTVRSQDTGVKAAGRPHSALQWPQASQAGHWHNLPTSKGPANKPQERAKCAHMGRFSDNSATHMHTTLPIYFLFNFLHLFFVFFE